jgi:hypothetical protein
MQTGSFETLIAWKSEKNHLCPSMGPNGDRGYGLRVVHQSTVLNWKKKNGQHCQASRVPDEKSKKE